ncbi:hypothetical protein Pmani_006834 [Petrolisthes manimaculis]|uniref:Uncharacterized protein n=1 Tax=Petrolisthes manimaculis TaxID=1843537 RepID=A0AAE1QAC2_9EUCA|nr:hypothetical protein Pmani_006834 [Petrolisthes manimaculis]
MLNISHGCQLQNTLCCVEGITEFKSRLITVYSIASGTMEYGTCWSYQLMSHLEVLWFPGLLKKPCNSPYGIAGQTTGAVFKVLQKPNKD